MAFEPLKRARLVRDSVIKQFEDGQESRWTLTLLANIGGSLGRGVLIDGTHLIMISTLQTQVRRRLVSVRSIEDDEIARRESVKVLDAILETIVVHFFTNPMSKWVALWKEAAPLFRRLCPEPSGSPINLPSLLQHPDVSLRHHAHMDIISSTLMDVPMLFRYDCTPQSIRSIWYHTGEAQHDSGAQWFHGTPDRFLAMFAKINAMREDGWVATPEIITVFERGIDEFQPAQGNSRDSFASVTRLVVHECWRQAAYIYLYMGLCGDSSDTPRVKQALKQFMKLLDGTKPGRRPDEFLVISLVLVAPAARKKRERETIRRRMHGLRVNGPAMGPTTI
ncbi:hypothetical protein B0J17DRAFT_713104 [Rhizoctonia solani]|nr:hypothetical protein B0J17DRAFT_713104 [Rhizoctonia solani]